MVQEEVNQALAVEFNHGTGAGAVVSISITEDEDVVSLNCWGHWGESQILWNPTSPKKNPSKSIEFDSMDLEEVLPYNKGELQIKQGEVFVGDSLIESSTLLHEGPLELVEDFEVDHLPLENVLEILTPLKERDLQEEVTFRRERKSLLIEEMTFPLHKQWKNLKKRSYDSAILETVSRVVIRVKPREVGVGFRDGNLLLLVEGGEYDIAFSIDPIE